jgi:hypothetical protein
MNQTQKADGMNYAPQGKPRPVVKAGEFIFAAAHLDHGHIYGQCNGLLEAGGELKWVYEPDEKKAAAFVARYPQAKSPARSTKSSPTRPCTSSPPPPCPATAGRSASA